ncbi:ubiquitin-like-conjugating enzyme ATG10 isoform X5 [Chiloscyllium punctatum]|uniref:ubiquitin-like-conjugating enzyme ATG10 isoform X5 n=1 Tax=Chiloscyllium punctatum TaxID=137246 RepID=UPI003B639CE9
MKTESAGETQKMSHTFNRNENICLGEEQFQKFCKLFIKHSDEICNGWEWRQKELNEGYMVKVHLRSKISLNSLFVEDHCFQDLQGHEVDDKEKLSVKNVSSDIEEAQVTTSQLIRYEYHVVYSSSYQAPVLYFRACYSDGKPLTLEEIWENVHDCYKERLFQGPWDTITQQECKLHHKLAEHDGASSGTRCTVELCHSCITGHF